MSKVRSRVESGDNTSKKNDLGNTALLCATENGNFVVAEYLATVSPWHTVNKAQRTFLETLEKVHSRDRINEVAKLRILKYAKVCSDHNASSTSFYSTILYYTSLHFTTLHSNLL